MSSTSRSRNFCMTSYEKEKPVFKSWMSYLIYGKEVCPTTSRQHWQCHFTTKNSMTLSSVIKKQAPHHVEVSKDPQASITYCQKEGKFEEHGEKPSQGQRSDLVTLKEGIMSGALTVQDIALSDPMAFHQYGRTLQYIEDLKKQQVKRNWVMECKWIVGPTGCGKTHKVVDEEKSLYMYPYEKAGWCDGYNGQEAILFDDYRGQLPLNEILRICDRYDYSLPRRNRIPIPITAKRIYFTSSKTPDEVYNKDDGNGDSISQLLRRIDVIRMDVNLD